MNSYETALEYYLKALDIANESGKTNAISNVKNSIGQLYFTQEKYGECIKYMLESLELAEEDNNLIVISDCNYYISMASLKLNKLEGILTPISKSYNIDSIQSNYRGLVHKSILFGDIYMALGQLNKAQFYYEKASDYCDLIQDKAQNITYVLLRLSNISISKKEYQKAISQLEKVVEISLKSQMKEMQYQAYEKLAEVYNHIGDHKKAFQFQKSYAQLKDSVINEERVKNFNQLQALYQDEQKTSEISRLKTESELQKANIEVEKAKASEKSKQNLLLIVGLVALTIIILTLFKLFKNKEKSNNILSRQNIEIEKQNQQKEILLKEIHHRVKNNLQVISSLLSLQSNDIVDTNALDAVKEGQNRVKSIALIHQKLYQNEDLSSVDFDVYAEELVSYLRAALQSTNSNIEINVEAHNVSLDIDTAVPLGLILNELVTNSLKYAFPNEEEGYVNISLEYSNKENMLQLKVEDNGIGLPANFDISKSTSLGLKLVRMLCQQLDGKLHYSNGSGSKFDIEISNTELRKSIA
jgi:two-component sensor histidine kinase